MMTGDQKLAWLIRNELLYKFGIKHEVFSLLKLAYPKALPESRSQFLRDVISQHKEDPNDPETSDYELYNLVVWLTKSDPTCALASHLLSTLKAKNPQFGEREHPDMDSWIGSVTSGGWDSEVTCDEITSYGVDQLVTELRNSPVTNRPGARSRQGVAQAIGHCAQTNREWGLSIAQEAVEKSIWSEDIWHPLISSWGATDLTPSEWNTVLKVLNSSGPILEVSLSGISSLLDRGVQSSTAPIPTNLLGPAKQLADQVWAHCKDEDLLGDQVDWLGRAINHTGGQLYQFYLHSLSRLQRDNLLDKEHLKQHQRVFTLAIEGTTIASQFARVVLVSQLHFLFYLDRDWTTSAIFPLLDPRVDSRRARQCWHGFLYWGRWSDEMLGELLPCYEGMFQFIETENDEIRRMFCGHLAGIAAYATINPLDQ
jgi:hypothetical protein